MLWLIIGGIGSGKTAFAEELALTVGREGIRLFCPPFPDNDNTTTQRYEETNADFPWEYSAADETLAHKLNAINLESNFYRADRRVIVVDSLSGWLRSVFNRIEPDYPDAQARIDAEWQEVLTAIVAFQGKIIVVTEDVAAGLFLGSRERDFLYKLAAANRRLVETSKVLYRITSGIAAEVKGYRLKRRHLTNENIYTDRR
ncbi:bifunctional adenosylcobinamide kinase/adenosylcobinamide-phosphate guanylyltransferase [Cohnella luojiensis]|uniref:Uncharacterized protein n=1 Tax=Cohnella luojiensis TaxID=652876 RepID=A0A4Y8M628_9BACL|nr:bifunctional adenosylcobinamide kinase/adenosylcobinamide-phosphate guanylyltransferase [Cohnella luojiensis]TFE28087.1 hypothetical protein E2980_07645 [Cohnella luojiensis]